MPAGEEVVFICPNCGEHIDVNESMRETLVRYGCVICGATVTPEDFSAHS